MTQPSYHSSFDGNAADNYQRYFVPRIPTPLARDLIDAAALATGERVLDVACGTGVVARLAAERLAGTGKVAGLDATAGMLAVARASTPAALAIEWYESTAEAMPLPDGAFDVVLCQLGLQFIANKLAALREIRRVLARGGRFLVSVPGPTPPMFAIMGDALARHIDPQLASFVNVVFALHDADELRELLSSAGFAEIEVRSARKSLPLPPPSDFLWQYIHATPMASMVAQAPEAQRAALDREICAKWQELVVAGTLTLELDMTTVRAR